jgi:hypothetical protein
MSMSGGLHEMEGCVSLSFIYALCLCYEPKRLMQQAGVRWCYINITIAILNIIHRPVFYVKYGVSETGFCLCLQVEPIDLRPIERATLCLRVRRQSTYIYWAQLSMINLKTEREYSLGNAVFYIKGRTIDIIQNLDYTIVRNLYILK